MLTKCAFLLLLSCSPPLYPQKAPPPHPLKTTSKSFLTLPARKDADQVEGDPSTYGYSDSFSLALGHGFNPNDVSGSPKVSCIVFTPEQLNAGPQETVFTLLYVKSTDQLNSAVGVDAKAEASYLTGKATLGSKIDTTVVNTDSAITVILRASTNFGRWGLRAGSTLSAPAQEWLKQPGVFSQRCGSRYVTWEDRGASVSAVITLHSISSQVKNTLDAEMTASGGWGPLTAKASTIFRDATTKASSQDRLQVQVFATGGSGLGGLGESVKALLKTNSGLDQATQALGTFLSTFTKDNAAVTGYRVASMEDYGWVSSDIPWTDEKEEKLRILAGEYRKLDHNIMIAKQIVAGSHPLAHITTPEGKEEIENSIAPSVNKLNLIAQRHHSCKSNAVSDLSACEIPIVYGVLSEEELQLNALEPPYFRINMQDLSEDEAKIVLNAPRNARLSFARSYKPQLEAIGAVIQAVAAYSLSLEMRFVDESGSDYATITGEMPAPYGGGTYLWYLDPHRGDGPELVEDVYDNFMKAYQGHHKGNIVWIVKDKMGRTFVLNFMTAEWTSNNGALTDVHYELVF